MKLRWYQLEALDNLERGWSAGHLCQALRMGTGTGKSATSAAAIRDHSGGALMMAHRSEIVAQLALALAREGIYHRVIGQDTLVRLCMAYQIDKLGTHFVRAGANVGVASVQTLARIKGEHAFLRQCTFVMCDEFHHYIRGGEFEKALAQFGPTTRFLGPTACTLRTAGKGLGRHASGIADALVLGPQESIMMQQGYLSPYKILMPPNDFHRDQIHLTAKGEFSPAEVKQEARRSTIFGDSVAHYCEHVPGSLALQFCDSIENAQLVVSKFRDAGVPAEVLSGKTEDGLRSRILKQFELRQVLVIASVALIDEGFDCPAVEVVLDTAATASLNRFRQRFGRGWRPAPGKVFRYFDFVGNVMQHGLPDAYREWTLNDRERASKSAPNDVEAVRTCLNPGSPLAADIPCQGVYPRFMSACPHCGFSPEPARRDGPEHVDGSLIELDEATRMAMLGEIARVDGPVYVPQGLARPAQIAVQRNHAARQMAQHTLRETLALWGGWKEHRGMTTDEARKAFYDRYGIATYQAATLGASEAAALEERVRQELQARGIISASVN